VHGFVGDNQQVRVALVAELFGFGKAVGGVARQNDDRVGCSRWLSIDQQDAGEREPDGQSDKYQRKYAESRQG